jgi:hypothetical protein
MPSGLKSRSAARSSQPLPAAFAVTTAASVNPKFV